MPWTDRCIAVKIENKNLTGADFIEPYKIRMNKGGNASFGFLKSLRVY